MSLPKIKEVRQLSDEQLSAKVMELKKHLANLRLLQATGRLEKPHQFKHAKHELAQLLTVERERQQQVEAETQAAKATEETPSNPSPEPALAATSTSEEA